MSKRNSYSNNNNNVNYFYLNSFSMVMMMMMIIALPVNACYIGNKQLQTCLHTYLERDFSILEELLRRPPYGENGHILIEEQELDQMCAKINEMKHCYENMMQGLKVKFSKFKLSLNIIIIIIIINSLYSLYWICPYETYYQNTAADSSKSLLRRYMANKESN